VPTWGDGRLDPGRVEFYKGEWYVHPGVVCWDPTSRDPTTSIWRRTEHAYDGNGIRVTVVAFGHMTQLDTDRSALVIAATGAITGVPRTTCSTDGGARWPGVRTTVRSACAAEA
jgi:hypothetical protein